MKAPLLLLMVVSLVIGVAILITRQNNPQDFSMQASPTPSASDGTVPSTSPSINPSPTPTQIPKPPPTKVSSPTPTPQSTPKPTPYPTPTPLVDKTYQMKVWVLSYLPTGNFYNETGDTVSFTKNRLLPAISEGSRFALKFSLSDEDIKVENNPPPIIGTRGTSGSYDYGALFEKYNLCNLAKQKDIKVVILWADGTGEYAGGMWEAAITGNKGIPTNGTILSYCPDKTIVVYGLNYTRGLAEALESYGHHLEAVFRRFRPEWYSWSGENQPQNPGLWGRGGSCGNVHNPPNARFEYDRVNTQVVKSDCRSWKPNGSGVKEDLSCDFWGCSTDGYLKWWMQNIPGIGNDLVGVDGQKIPNWWVYIADPDKCYNSPLSC